MADENTAGEASPESLERRTWRWELFRTEYESLREESTRAHDSQHHILQWSLAAYGVLFLAALAFTEPEPGNPASPGGSFDPYFMQLGFFLIVLPLLITASMLLWLAELYRIERVGAYLRSRERCWSEGLFPDTQEGLTRCLRSRDYPLMWENTIQGPGKELRNFTTGFLLYGVAVVFAVGVSFVDVLMTDTPLAFELAAIGVGIVVVIIYFRLIPWKFQKDIADIGRLFPEDRQRHVDDRKRSPWAAKLLFRLIGLSDPYLTRVENA